MTKIFISETYIMNFKKIAENPIYGQIVEVQTVYLERVRISERQYESGAPQLFMFTTTGERKRGKLLHRDNVMSDHSDLPESSLLQQELQAKGYKIGRYPRSRQQRWNLMTAGYKPYLKTTTGAIIESPLGLVWAKTSEATVMEGK